ncbi:ABC transporter ATP-binding protein [Mucilaginibacter sp. KACC 22063]|uniref:ABC transporter ATP-binding protein n=1 Tax=Mucilaginibacter sp. KACC 22063 TaxID=3025666 RepID=UPI002365DCB3|nr:ABC transporter ATP-binding protein [Mucilaginibacter sp. KACC 22063]WDF56226.1 ABC transporter ATP-binding protein [Mucilaginibacter sp. KACC 22063]
MERKTIRIFLSYLYPYWYKEVGLFLLIIGGTAASLASPYCLKIIIDKVIPQKDYRSLILILLGLVFVYIIRLSMSCCSDYLNTWLSNRIVNDIKITLFKNLINKPYAYFDENKPGDIVQKVNNEIHKVQYFLTNSLIRLLNNVFSIIGISVMLCILNYRLFFVSILIFPFSIFINRYSNKKVKYFIEKSCKKEGDIYSFYIDRIKNIKLIKGFNALNNEMRLLTTELNNIFSLYLKTSLYSSISGNAATFFVALGPIIVLAYGGHLVISGLLSIGSVVAFIQYMNRVYSPSNDMVSLYLEYVKAKVSMNRIQDLLEVTENTQNQHHITLSEIDTISFNNVSFGYDENKVIEGFNIELRRGMRYGFVGLSGSGKSTLIKLLGKFYDVEKGSIIVNDSLKINDISNFSWNESVTIVHQEPLILIETVKDNLLYGNPDASEDDLWSVLKFVQLADFIKKMPLQLDTLIGEGGINLSGGQLQQVALARALLKKSKMLILDEATSAIDSFKEDNILRNLREHFNDKIILSISHRLSSIKDFDEIILLEDGKIVEKGAHDDLLNLKGSYYSLFESQLNTARASVY